MQTPNGYGAAMKDHRGAEPYERRIGQLDANPPDNAVRAHLFHIAIKKLGAHATGLKVQYFRVSTNRNCRAEHPTADLSHNIAATGFQPHNTLDCKPLIEIARRGITVARGAMGIFGG
jgi:hypothetical protein